MIVFTFIITMIPLFTIMIFIPYWTRKTESFGVSIPKTIYDTEELKNMRKNYALRGAILSIFFTLIFIPLYLTVKSNENLLAIVFTGVVLIYLLLSFFIYLSFHKKMKQLKTKQQWKKEKKEQLVLNIRFREMKSAVSNLYYIIPLLIPIVGIYLTIIYYDTFPDQIPMHYNFSGEVTRYSDKSYGTLLVLPFISLFLTGMMLLINWGITQAKQQIDADQPEVSMKQNMIFRRRWSIFLFYTTLLVNLMLALFHLQLIYPIPPVISFITPFLLTGIIIIWALILSVTTGQGGSKVRIDTPTEKELINPDDDEHWKLGMFYFNKDDPTLLLEKRFGIGWTFNWARPAAWIIIILILVFSIAIPILLTEIL